MVVAGIDQFQRDHAATQQVAHLLVPADRRANAVAGQQRVAAEEGIAGPLEKRVRFEEAKLETVLGEPGLGVGFLDLPLRMAKTGGNGHIAVDHRRIGGEDQVGHAGQRRACIRFSPRIAPRSSQVLPLRHGQIAVGPQPAVHPRVDLVFNAVVVRRTHEDAGCGMGSIEGRRGRREGWEESVMASPLLPFFPTKPPVHRPRPQERGHVRDQAYRLKGTAIGQLDGGRGIDVHAHDVNPGRQQIADGDRMQRRGDHQAKGNVVDFSRISCCATSTSVTTSGSGPSSRMLPASRKVDAVANALVHDARGAAGPFRRRGGFRPARRMRLIARR